MDAGLAVYIGMGIAHKHGPPTGGNLTEKEKSHGSEESQQEQQEHQASEQAQETPAHQATS